MNLGGGGLQETMLTTSQVELDELKSLEFFLLIFFACMANMLSLYVWGGERGNVKLIDNKSIGTTCTRGSYMLSNFISSL